MLQKGAQCLTLIRISASGENFENILIQNLFLIHFPDILYMTPLSCFIVAIFAQVSIMAHGPLFFNRNYWVCVKQFIFSCVSQLPV